MSDNPFGRLNPVFDPNNPVIDPDKPLDPINPVRFEPSNAQVLSNLIEKLEELQTALQKLQTKVNTIDDNTEPKPQSLDTVRWNVQVSGIARMSDKNTHQLILSVLVTHSGNIPVPDLKVEHFTLTEHLPMDFSGLFGAVPTPAVKVHPIQSAVWFTESGRGMYQVVSLIPFELSVPRRLFTILASKGGAPAGAGMGSVALQTQHPADD